MLKKQWPIYTCILQQMHMVSMLTWLDCQTICEVVSRILQLISDKHAQNCNK